MACRSINFKTDFISLGGFWDDSSNKQPIQKPSSVTKSNSTNSVNVGAKQQQQSQQKQPQAQQQQQPKTKAKKEETHKMNHNNNNNGPLDDFTNWCYRSLSNISSDVDSKYQQKVLFLKIIIIKTIHVSCQKILILLDKKFQSGFL